MTPSPRWSRARSELPALVVLCLGAGLAIRNFWRPGVINDADMLIGVYRVFALDQAWHERVLFPRIASAINFGYGGPLFQYYPPLVSYLALPFHWLGFGYIEASKAVFTLALLLAGMGTYAYGRRLFGDRRAALAAGAAYMLAPYLLLDVHERGALAELIALALLPWLFLAAHGLLRSGRGTPFWATAVLTALLMLAHNITALFVLPLLAGYLAALVLHERASRRLPWVALAVALGLGLSAFYWAPALIERGYTQIEASMVGDAAKSATANLAHPTGLVQPALAHDYWGDLRFRFGLGQTLLAALAILAIAVQPRRWRYPLASLALALLITLYLQTTLSRPFWEALPLVRFIQFPWRLLGPAAFFSALLIGSLVCWPRLAGAPGLVATALILLCVAYAGIARLDPGLQPGWYRISSAQINTRDLYSRAARGYPLYSDYKPVDAGCDLAQSRAGQLAGAPLPAAAPTLQVTSESLAEVRLQVRTAQPFVISLPRLYFPLWEVEVAGKPVATWPSRPCGLVAAELPAGDYVVIVHFADTLLRRVTVAVSVLCLLILLIGAARTAPFNRALPAGAGLIVVLAFLCVWHQGLGQPARRPVAQAVIFGDEITLSGYHLGRTALRPGDTLALRLYWLALKQPRADYHVFVHLNRLDDSGKVAQDDSQPSLDSSPTSRWQAGELVVDEHQLPIPEDVPPGAYQVVIGVYHPATVQNLPISGSTDLLPGNRVPLARVEVRGR